MSNCIRYWDTLEGYLGLQTTSELMRSPALLWLKRPHLSRRHSGSGLIPPYVNSILEEAISLQTYEKAE